MYLPVNLKANFQVDPVVLPGLLLGQDFGLEPVALRRAEDPVEQDPAHYHAQGHAPSVIKLRGV